MSLRKSRANLILFLQTAFGRLVRLLLGPHVTALMVRIPSGVFAVDPEDNGVGGHMRRRGSYAEDELTRIDSLLTPASRVLVVGAHVGTLAIPIAKRCAGVVAIEANPRTFELLKMNVALNGAGNCETIRTAVSDRRETINFQLGRNNSGNSKRSPRIREYLDYYDKPETIAVDAVRLDDLFPGKTFDLIVMDIEGSEYLALKGMPEILERSGTLIVEFMPQTMRSVDNVTVDEFVGAVEPFFSRLYVPSRDLHLDRSNFRKTLQEMYDRDQPDSGVIFQK